jgi:hypothetical protein
MLPNAAIRKVSSRRTCATGVQAARRRPGRVGRARISYAIRLAPILDAGSPAGALSAARLPPSQPRFAGAWERQARLLENASQLLFFTD